MIGSQWMETFVSPNSAKEEEQKPYIYSYIVIYILCIIIYINNSTLL